MTQDHLDPTMGEREFRELADNAPVMIWRSRPDKLCDWFNKPWQEFSGRTQEALFGYGWAEDVHPDDFDRCVSTYTTAFDAREKFTMPYRLRRADGVYRWFLDNGAPFYRNGEFAGYFGSCIDITEHRELEEHQRTLLAELNHRVRNNLQLIMSFLQVSKLRAASTEAKELLQGAIARVRGVGIIQDELHKNTSGVVELGDYLANLARSVMRSEAGDGVRLVADTGKVEVHYDLASNLGLVVNELVTNAVKHAGPGFDRIDLSVVQDAGGTIVMRVADNGVGFGAAGADTAANPAAGAMHGHQLIDALVRRCGGSLTRENAGGATVTVRIPRLAG